MIDFACDHSLLLLQFYEELWHCTLANFLPNQFQTAKYDANDRYVLIRTYLSLSRPGRHVPATSRAEYPKRFLTGMRTINALNQKREKQNQASASQQRPADGSDKESRADSGAAADEDDKAPASKRRRVAGTSEHMSGGAPSPRDPKPHAKLSTRPTAPIQLQQPSCSHSTLPSGQHCKPPKDHGAGFVGHGNQQRGHHSYEGHATACPMYTPQHEQQQHAAQEWLQEWLRPPLLDVPPFPLDSSIQFTPPAHPNQVMFEDRSINVPSTEPDGWQHIPPLPPADSPVYFPGPAPVDHASSWAAPYEPPLVCNLPQYRSVHYLHYSPCDMEFDMEIDCGEMSNGAAGANPRPNVISDDGTGYLAGLDDHPAQQQQQQQLIGKGLPGHGDEGIMWQAIYELIAKIINFMKTRKCPRVTVAMLKQLPLFTPELTPYITVSL